MSTPPLLEEPFPRFHRNCCLPLLTSCSHFLEGIMPTPPYPNLSLASLGGGTPMAPLQEAAITTPFSTRWSPPCPRE